MRTAKLLEAYIQRNERAHENFEREQVERPHQRPWAMLAFSHYFDTEGLAGVAHALLRAVSRLIATPLD
jgi:hypothetical protein